MQSTFTQATSKHVAPKQAALEHLNVTVKDYEQTAKVLADIFGWSIRWQGAAKDNGQTIHLGELGINNTYLALYGHPDKHKTDSSHKTLNQLNHIGIQVEDIDQIESRVKALKLVTHNHGDYEPGRRFYFNLEDGLEIEVVSYH